MRAKLNNQEIKQQRRTGQTGMKPIIEQKQTKRTKQAEAFLAYPKGDTEQASDRVKSRKSG
jgi:hypothetical protein